MNTVDFVVNNADASAGFTGLRMDGLTAIGLIPANTPPHIVIAPAGRQRTAQRYLQPDGGRQRFRPSHLPVVQGLDPLETATEPTLVLDIDTPAAPATTRSRSATAWLPPR